MAGKLGAARGDGPRQGRSTARRRSATAVAVVVAAALGATGGLWQARPSGELERLRAAIAVLEAELGQQRAGLRADLRASEAMRLRLEERLKPAAGVTDTELDVDAAARLAGLQHDRLPGDAPTWALDGIVFAPASDRFAADAYPDLARLGVLAQLCHDHVLELGGGGPDIAVGLALQRNARIRDYLLQHFEIEPDRIKVAVGEGAAAGPLRVRLVR